jgi:hypothetical protein
VTHAARVADAVTRDEIRRRTAVTTRPVVQEPCSPPRCHGQTSGGTRPFYALDGIVPGSARASGSRCSAAPDRARRRFHVLGVWPSRCRSSGVAGSTALVSHREACGRATGIAYVSGFQPTLYHFVRERRSRPGCTRRGRPCTRRPVALELVGLGAKLTTYRQSCPGARRSACRPRAALSSRAPLRRAIGRSDSTPGTGARPDRCASGEFGFALVGRPTAVMSPPATRRASASRRGAIVGEEEMDEDRGPLVRRLCVLRPDVRAWSLAAVGLLAAMPPSSDIPARWAVGGFAACRSTGKARSQATSTQPRSPAGSRGNRGRRSGRDCDRPVRRVGGPKSGNDPGGRGRSSRFRLATCQSTRSGSREGR